MYNVYSIFIEEFYYRYRKSLASMIRYLKRIANDESVVAVAKKLQLVGMNRNLRQFILQ